MRYGCLNQLVRNGVYFCFFAELLEMGLVLNGVGKPNKTGLGCWVLMCNFLNTRSCHIVKHCHIIAQIDIYTKKLIKETNYTHF